MSSNRLPDYQGLAHLSMGYTCVDGMYPRVTNPFAAERTILLAQNVTFRTTCMPYPRRQRSS